MVCLSLVFKNGLTWIEEFFEPPRDSKTVPAIEDFFAGAFTYHYHNQMYVASVDSQACSLSLQVDCL